MDASEAARALGSIRTEKKAAASRKNGQLGGGVLKPLVAIHCSCGVEGLDGHKSTCKRGRAIKYRRSKGLPLVMMGTQVTPSDPGVSDESAILLAGQQTCP